jgi:hypothetical protein
MRKSNFFAGIMFLAAAATFNLAVAQSALQYDIVQDQYGSIIGQISGNGASITVDSSTNTASVPVLTRTAPPPAGTMSAQAPAFTATPTTVTVKIPASSPVAFCSSGDYYNKATGKCADGKFPYKIVPVGSLSDPKAQTPNVACTSPKVATFNSATKTWQCIVPLGFKLSLGN